MSQKRPGEKPCTGCGQETACAYYDGDHKVPLCLECVEQMRREPEARRVVLAEVSAPTN